MPSVRKPSVTSGRGPIRPMNRAWVHAPHVQASVAAVRAIPASIADVPRVSSRASAT